MPATRGEVEGGGWATNYQKFMNDSAKWVGREDGGVRRVGCCWAGGQVSRSERRPRPPQPCKRSRCDQCHGYRRLCRSESLLSIILAAPAIWSPPRPQRPPPTPSSTSQRHFFLSLLTWGFTQRTRRVKTPSGIFGRCGSPATAAACRRAFAAVYLHRKRSRWLCRQRACVCQPMEQERLEGLQLRGGAETQEEAAGVGGWGWGGSDGVRRRRWGAETARIELEAAGRLLLKQ